MAKPEALNSGAIAVINRVSAKLTGRDFRPKRNSGSGHSANSGSANASTNASTNANAFTDFSPTLSTASMTMSTSVPEWPLSVEAQVERLIGEASRIENLCQAYVGWCPFW